MLTLAVTEKTYLATIQVEIDTCSSAKCQVNRNFKNGPRSDRRFTRDRTDKRDDRLQ